MPGAGIQHVPIRYPSESPPWFTQWMDHFIKDVLAKMDTRNAIPGLGIGITGQPSEPATISASEDLGLLFDADFAMAEASPLLPNARRLAGESTVVSITDGGPGGTLRIGLEVHGIQPEKLAMFPRHAVLANGANDVAPAGFVRALLNDTLLRRVGDVLEFAGLTVGMAADGLWTKAKLHADVQASLDLADSALQPTTGYTVADLATLTPAQGDRTFVTDATAPTFLAVLVGGGAVVCPAFYDGTNWVCA